MTASFEERVDSMNSDTDSLTNNNAVEYRLANLSDVASLVALETKCFESDRLSKRRFKHWVQASNGIFVIAQNHESICGYGLVILRKATRSARLYSLAIDSEYRGQGIASDLLAHLEQLTLSKQRLFMRLEVAETNLTAITLYKRLGYRQFGVYKHYYQDGTHALRLQKSLHPDAVQARLPAYPWYQQSTDFSCGPAALMMALNSLKPSFGCSVEQELDIWRQANTVFMTSGHAGCHPVGLALATQKLGFEAEVFVNQTSDLFIDGVRSGHKKSILQVVDNQFFERAKQDQIEVHNREYQLEDIADALAKGHAVICLISTYQFDHKKAPHWVAITHIDQTFLYFHDPDASVEGISADSSLLEEQSLYQTSELDYQHVPIIKEDFAKLSIFGKSKLKTCLVIKRMALKKEL